MLMLLLNSTNLILQRKLGICATISFVTQSCLKLKNIVSTISARLLWDSRLSSSLYHYSYSRRPGARHTTPGSRRVAKHLVRPLPLASACSAPRRKLQIRAPRVNSASTTTCPVARTADCWLESGDRTKRRYTSPLQTITVLLPFFIKTATF